MNKRKKSTCNRKNSVAIDIQTAEFRDHGTSGFWRTNRDVLVSAS